MKNQKTVLITVSYLINEDEDQISTGVLEKVKCKMSQSLELDLGKKTSLNWTCTSTQILNPELINCGKCENCGQWVTDMEKPEPVEGLCTGATVDGKLLCDECLPSDHRWAF